MKNADDPSIETNAGQESLRTAGQRRVNIIWEVTQSVIAVSTVFSVLAVSAYLAIAGEKDASTAALVSLTGMGSLIVGFYFSRTNHERVGGVGGDSAGRRSS